MKTNYINAVKMHFMSYCVVVKVRDRVVEM